MSPLYVSIQAGESLCNYDVELNSGPFFICTMTIGESCSRGPVPFDVDDFTELYNTLLALDFHSKSINLVK